MSENENSYTPTDEKVLAMNYALTALLKLLHQQGLIHVGDYVHEMNGAFGALLRAGETGAAAYLENYRSHLCDVFQLPSPEEH